MSNRVASLRKWFVSLLDDALEFLKNLKGESIILSFFSTLSRIFIFLIYSIVTMLWREEGRG